MRTIFLTLALFALVACGNESSSEDYLAQAKAYFAQRDESAAIIELKNALRLDGGSAEARWLLGKTYLDHGDFPAAESELQRAQDLGWAADDVRPALAKSLVAQGRFAEVLELDDQGLSDLSAAKLLSSQAMAALSAQQADKAGQLVAAALGKAPDLLEVKLAQATVALREGEPAEVLDIVDPILAAAPDSGEAWWLKGQALVRQGKLEEARSALDQSIAHSNAALADITARALVNLRLLDNDAAQADATALLKASPKDPVANYVQGVIHFRNKQYRKAVTALSLAEPAATQFPMTLYYLCLGYLIEKELSLSEKFGEQYVALQPDDAIGRKLLASILVLQNKPGRAQDILQPVVDRNPDDVPALNLLANALLLDGQADIGMVLYARIAQLQPDWRIIPLRLEANLVTQASSEGLSQKAGAAPDSSNYPQTEILLILNRLAEKDFEGAIAAAEAYHVRDFESLAPYHVLGRVYLAAGQPDKAREVLEKALQRAPADPSANLGLAQMALAAGEPGRARKYYQAILDAHLDDLSTLLQLSALEASENNEAAMVARLNQARQAHPTALEPRIRLARYYVGTGSPGKVPPLFAKLSRLQRQSPQVLELTGMAQLGLKQPTEALATLQQLVEAKPDSAYYRYLLSMAESQSGDEQRARQELMEAVHLDPKHVPSLLTLARIAQRDGQQAQFEQYLATLVEVAPEAPDVLRLQADSARVSGDVTDALAISQRAFSQAPTSQGVLQLANLQKAAGQHDAARRTLQQWVAQHPADVTVRLVLAYGLEVDNAAAAAREQYLAVLKLEPGNVNALNNLAWSLRKENPQKALLYIRKAASLAPDTPLILDTLAVIESLSGDQETALLTIRRALKVQPGDATLRYHEAMIVAAAGDKAQAIASLEDLMANDSGEFPERAEAEALLKTLKG